MVVYNPAEHEALALMWYKMLADENELKTTFYKSMHTITGFLGNWSNSRSTLLMDGDDKGPAVCVWFEPLFDGVCVGAWVRKDMRGHVMPMRFIIDAFGRAAKQWTTLIAMTVQSDVVSYLKRLGFRHKLNVPNLMDGKPVAVCYAELDDLTLYRNVVE